MLRLSDIAIRAGVSPTTVSFVLNDKQSENVRISEKTRLKVLKAAEEMGYRSNQLAQAIRTGNSRMLGVLGGDLSEQHVGRMLTGAIEAADAHGYTLKMLRYGSFAENPNQAIRRSSELRLMGVIALHLPQEVVDELHAEATRYGYPLILMDSRSDSLEVPQVVTDDESGIGAGVDHLVSLGHSRIAFISTRDIPSRFIFAREKAFVEAMKRHGLPVPEHFMARGSFREREPSLQAARDLLRRPAGERPTAVFCISDIIASVVLQVAMELGLRVPRDCSVMGFANLGISEFVNPPLTTIEQPFTELGRVAVETLLSHIHSDGELAAPAPPAPGGCIKLPTRLIVRASTAPPPEPH